MIWMSLFGVLVALVSTMAYLANTGVLDDIHRQGGQRQPEDDS